jgi:hypothetical protein
MTIDSIHENTSEAVNAAEHFPPCWQKFDDIDPNQHVIKIERYDRRTQTKKQTDYLTVRRQLQWFIRDQPALIITGLAKYPYIIQTDLVEIDRKIGWAHFKASIRDVLGNEASMHDSEAMNNFPDFPEKAISLFTEVKA